MQRIKLGKSDLEVPAICLGGNVFGWTVSEKDSFRLLDTALEAGLDFIDTADVYSRWAPGHQGGESETILGKWLSIGNKRSNVILATKVGMDLGSGKVGLKAAYIEQAVEDSLRRLQTDYIDLYQAHKDDNTTPLEETLGAFDKLVRQGKVRHIGASNYSGTRLEQALAVSKDNGLVSFVSLQPHYNLVAREAFETDLLPVVQKHTIGVIPYYSLAAGFLTGKYRSKQDADGKARGGTVGKYLNEWGWSVLQVLDEIAKTHHSTPARVALAWLMIQPGVTAPIASATSDAHLADLVEATRLKLDHASIEKLNSVSTPAVTAKPKKNPKTAFSSTKPGGPYLTALFSGEMRQMRTPLSAICEIYREAHDSAGAPALSESKSQLACVSTYGNANAITESPCFVPSLPLPPAASTTYCLPLSM